MNWSWEPTLPLSFLIIVFIGALAALIWSYMRHRKNQVTAAGYLLLRCVSLVLIAGALAGPVMVKSPEPRSRRQVLIYLDASDSMKADTRRLAEAMEKVFRESETPHEIVYFGRNLAGTEEAVDAGGTSLSLPLIDAADRMPSAVILASDGLFNEGGSPLSAWKPAVGRIMAVFPERETPAYRLNPAPGRDASAGRPGITLPDRAIAGREFPVVIRTEGGGGRGALTVSVRGPVEDSNIDKLAMAGEMSLDLSGGGESKHEISFKCPRAGYYLVEASVEWHGGSDRTTRFLEVLPGPLNAVYLEGSIGWRVAALRHCRLRAGEEMAMSIFRLYAGEPGADRALAAAEVVLLGTFPEDGLPVPLRVALRKAADRGCGFVFIWGPESSRWTDILDAPAPEYADGIMEYNIPVVLSGYAESELSLPSFEFVPVWSEEWAFAEDARPLFRGAGGYSPCWIREKEPARTVYLQDACLKALMSVKESVDFLTGLAYWSAGRERSRSDLRLKLSRTDIPPGGLLEVQAVGGLLQEKGLISLSMYTDGKEENIAQGSSGGGGGFAHVLKLNRSGKYVLRAGYRGEVKKAETWAACRVSGTGREDALEPPDKDLLEALVELSRGRMAAEKSLAAEVPEFLKDIPQPQPRPATRKPWRNQFVVWFVILAGLFVEWTLRTR